MGNGIIIPPIDEIESVPYTTGSNVSVLYGQIFRKGKLIYFSFYADGNFTNTQPIISIRDAKDCPKTAINIGGAYWDAGGTTGAGIFHWGINGNLCQSMTTSDMNKRVSISGVYEAAY